MFLSGRTARTRVVGLVRAEPVAGHEALGRQITPAATSRLRERVDRVVVRLVTLIPARTARPRRRRPLADSRPSPRRPCFAVAFLFLLARLGRLVRLLLANIGRQRPLKRPETRGGAGLRPDAGPQTSEDNTLTLLVGPALPAIQTRVTLPEEEKVPVPGLAKRAANRPDAATLVPKRHAVAPKTKPALVMTDGLSRLAAESPRQ